jgi:hypothetical protein
LLSCVYYTRERRECPEKSLENIRDKVENVCNPKKESSNTEDEVLDHGHKCPCEEEKERDLNCFEHGYIIPYRERISREKQRNFLS